MGTKPLKALGGYRAPNRGSKGSRKNTRGYPFPFLEVSCGEFPNLVVSNNWLCEIFTWKRSLAIFCALFALVSGFVSVDTPAEPRGEKMFYYCKFWAVNNF